MNAFVKGGELPGTFLIQNCGFGCNPGHRFEQAGKGGDTVETYGHADIFYGYALLQELFCMG
jgi:hypothetical protein